MQRVNAEAWFGHGARPYEDQRGNFGDQEQWSLIGSPDVQGQTPIAGSNSTSRLVVCLFGLQVGLQQRYGCVPYW